MTNNSYEEILLGGFDAAVQSAVPQNCMAPFMPDKPAGNIYVIGAGKASAKMAQVFEKLCPYDFEGMVVTRYGHAVETQKIKVYEAAHPVPDEAGAEATLDMLRFLEKTTQDDLVVCLLSGGGSALLTCPIEGLSLSDVQRLTKDLLYSGATIREINTVRKHINQAFGGKLAKAAMPAKLVTLSISDVAGDDPSIIASGPTVGDPSTLKDALSILEKYNIEISDAMRLHLHDEKNETLKPDNAIFNKTEYHLIATPQKSLEVAADYLRDKGYEPYIISSEVEGDTNDAAKDHVSLIQKIIETGHPVKRPCAVLSGGETTVKVTGNGEGGPNTQFMLSSAILLNGLDGVYGLSCDTDGIDGSQNNAGAIINPKTLNLAKEKGLNPEEFLLNNDSYGFFDALDNRVAPGPTHTNVNDFRLFLIL